jgi:hypothetical protein
MLGQCWDNLNLTIESGFGHIPQLGASTAGSPGLAETADHSLPLDWAGSGQSLATLVFKIFKAIARK